MLMLHDIGLQNNNYHFNNLHYWLFKPCSSSKVNAGLGQAKLPVLY